MKNVKLNKTLKSAIVDAIVDRSAQKKALDEAVVGYHEAGYNLVTEMHGGIDALKFIKEKINELGSLASHCFDAGMVRSSLQGRRSLYSAVRIGLSDIEDLKENGASSDLLERLTEFNSVYGRYGHYCENRKSIAINLDSSKVAMPEHLDIFLVNDGPWVSVDTYNNHPDACNAFIDAVKHHFACSQDLNKFESEIREFIDSYTGTSKLIQDVPDLAPIIVSCLPEPDTSKTADNYPMVLAQKVTTSLLDAGVIPVETTEEVAA